MVLKINNIASNFWKQNILKLYNIESIKNELKQILEFFFVSRIDKLANNACIMCIHHIRLQAWSHL